MKRAVIYARVSTKEQAEEGYSIDAQLEAARRFVDERGWALDQEYVDRGESARTIDRPQFQLMLDHLSETKAVSFVVIHKLDRLARNIEDYATVRGRLRRLSVGLVSVTENLQETPSGRMHEGMLAVMAEFYSANLATEVMKGMRKAAQSGIWPGVAPVGYRNARAENGGRRSEAVLLTDEMAPLVTEAFELYATGEWSVRDLLGKMTQRGLRTKSGRPLVHSKMCTMLKNKIYIGLIVWAGLEVKGNHEPLVSKELFERVQAVMTSHDKAGTRHRIHDHFLRGTVYCAVCGSRMSSMKAKHGKFEYFYCVGKHARRTACTQAYIPSADLEVLVEEVYARVRFSKEKAELVRAEMDREIELHVTGAGKAAKRYERRMAVLESQRQKALKAYYAEAISLPLLKTEQERIDGEIADINQKIGVDRGRLENARKVGEVAIELLNNCAASYKNATPEGQRSWNRSLFKGIYVADRQVQQLKYQDLFHAIFRAGGNPPDSGLSSPEGKAKNPVPPTLAWTGSSKKQLAPHESHYSNGRFPPGSNKVSLVDPRGFEPLTS